MRKECKVQQNKIKLTKDNCVEKKCAKTTKCTGLVMIERPSAAFSPS
jgi:hypothetical protein